MVQHRSLRQSHLLAVAVAGLGHLRTLQHHRGQRQAEAVAVLVVMQAQDLAARRGIRQQPHHRREIAEALAHSSLSQEWRLAVVVVQAQSAVMVCLEHRAVLVVQELQAASAEAARHMQAVVVADTAGIQALEQRFRVALAARVVEVEVQEMHLRQSQALPIQEVVAVAALLRIWAVVDK